MMKIKGKVNTALCFAGIIEDEAVDIIEVLKPIYNFKAN